MKLSIILPIYNININLIKRCINSIKNQDYDNFECILIDDGSSDEYVHKKYYNELIKDKRFSYHYFENGGLPVARNRGYDLSTGDIIWFVDPDDYISENIFLYIVNIFKSNDIDYFAGCYTKIEKNSINEIILKTDEGDYENTLGEIKLSYFTHSWQTVWKNVYKKEFLEKNNIRHQNYKTSYEDVYFDLLVKNNAKKIYLSNKNIYFYDRTRDSSITNTNAKHNTYIKIIAKNINESYTDIKKNSILNDIYFLHVWCQYAFIPFTEKNILLDILKKSNKYINKNNGFNFKIKLSFWICKINILRFLYKKNIYWIIRLRKLLL